MSASEPRETALSPEAREERSPNDSPRAEWAHYEQGEPRSDDEPIIWGCENGHISKRYLKSEELCANVCLACHKPVFLIRKKESLAGQRMTASDLRNMNDVWREIRWEGETIQIRRDGLREDIRTMLDEITTLRQERDAARAHVLAELAKGGPLKERDRELVHTAMTMLQNSDREPVADLFGRLLSAHDSALATIAALRAALAAAEQKAAEMERERDEQIASAFAEYERDMVTDGIPAIIAARKLRAALAEDARNRVMKPIEADVRSMLHEVHEETRHVRERESAGEQVSGDTMDFRMRQD